MSRRWIAACLSLLLPGAGHLYAGRPWRALGVAVATGALLLPAALWIWTFPARSAGSLRGFAALGLLALPAIDAWRLAGRPTVRTVRRSLALAAGFALPLLLLLSLELDYALIAYRWLSPMRLDRESMRPNLIPGDLLLVDVRPPAPEELEPGDLVVFEHPAGSGRLHVKRLAALAGEEVSLRGGALVVDGVPRARSGEGDPSPLQEEQLGARRYITRPGVEGQGEFGPLRVPAGSFFALGDDRPASRDSRSFGPIPLSLLRGRPLRVAWSNDPESGALRWDRIGHDPASSALR